MSQQTIKIYVRNSKKYGKILNTSKEVSGKQLYRLAADSQNLSSQEVHLFFGGKLLSIDEELVSLKEKAIVHLINLNQVNVPSIQLNIRSLFGTIEPVTLQTQSDTNIQSFIDEQLYPIYGQKSDRLLLVHIGRQLNPSKTFRQELIQNQSQLTCANLQEIKSRKANQNKESAQSTLNLPIKDLEVPEQPKDIYVQPNFTIAVPQEVEATNNLELIFDSKVRHATSLPNCELQPEEIIPEEQLTSKPSEEVQDEGEREEVSQQQEIAVQSSIPVEEPEQPQGQSLQKEQKEEAVQQSQENSNQQNELL